MGLARAVLFRLPRPGGLCLGRRNQKSAGSQIGTFHWVWILENLTAGLNYLSLQNSFGGTCNSICFALLLLTFYHFLLTTSICNGNTTNGCILYIGV